MKFIEARRIRVGDTVFFPGDEVSEIPARVIGIARRKMGELAFHASWTFDSGVFTDTEPCQENERCLLIKRPRKQ